MHDPPPELGRINFGDLRRLAPLDGYFGYGRGTPVDRHYIGAFLGRHANAIAGSVLEIKDAQYTRLLGGERVSRSDVLDLDPGNPAATLHADLTRPEQLPREEYDCVICTQTLQFFSGPASGVRGLERLLRPGGVALVTVPGITQSDPANRSRWGEYWRFTAMSLRWLLEPAFPGGVEVETYGNVLAATALLWGMAAEELRREELNH